MLDVHPAHHAATTWRDFFIHIATICIGLLIAIGLEQAVEAVHHRHQRHQLEEQLQSETERNLALVHTNLVNMKAQRAFVNASIVALNQAPVTQGRISLSALPKAGDVFDVGPLQPSQTVWAVAKANGAVGLLPENEAQVYARLDYEGDQLTLDADFDRASNEVLSLLQSRKGLPPAEAATLTIAERDALALGLAKLSVQYRSLITLELNESGACRGVLHGAGSVDEMIKYMLEEYKQISQY